MALVTYIGKASRIRIAFDIVLERLVPTPVPVHIARGLSPRDFDVVMPTRRPPAKPKSTTTKRAARRAATKKES